MKKILLFITTSILSITITNASLCVDEQNAHDNYYNQVQQLESEAKNVNPNSYYRKLDDLRFEYKKAKERLESCISKNKSKQTENELYFKWIDYYNKKRYIQAINSIESYINTTSDIEAFDILSKIYYEYASSLYDEKKYNLAIEYYNKAINAWKRDFYTYYNLWISYSNISENMYAFDAFYEALYSTNDQELEKIAQNKCDTSIKNVKSAKKITNDPEVNQQFYLKQINIEKAWKKVKNNKEVVVAVIDDWVNINDPDLKDSIWISPNYKYGDSKVIDFTWNWYKNLADWTHWTAVAWVIWAKQNNNIWIAWIAKNIKIMPLRVSSWSIIKEEYMVNAIEYAINNKANIINISIWSSQFVYSTDFDKVIKKAYDNGIIVIISAWNWDIYNYNTRWLDLDTNPISPVCNNWNKHYSIWVYSLDINWKQSNRSNYWSCARIWAPWENIYALSIPMYNEWKLYDYMSWTSFSAPIVAWIVALWYNQYWFVEPDIVQYALEKSFTFDYVYNYKIDAEKYIDELWRILELKKNL